MDFETKKEEVVEKKPRTNWDIKERNIQIAQSVNLAVEELTATAYPKSPNVVFDAEQVKELARKYNKILTELKGE
jgi:hypothetical protein